MTAPTTASPGPGCAHVGPIESLAPAEPERYRCRHCYGPVWPDAEGHVLSLAEARAAGASEGDYTTGPEPPFTTTPTG